MSPVAASTFRRCATDTSAPITARRSLRMGGCIITTGCHAPFELRDQVAALLGCPPSTIVVRSGSSGGSFGGLLDAAVPALAAIAAWTLQSGVELDVGASAHRAFGPHSNAIGAEITMACDADGRVCALELDVRVDAGAYTSYGLGVMRRILAHAAGPYDVEHVHAGGTLLWTNDRPASAFRGFGVGPHTVMLEAMVESLAADLGIDALDVRERSLARCRRRARQRPAGACQAGLHALPRALPRLPATSYWPSPSRYRRTKNSPSVHRCSSTASGTRANAIQRRCESSRRRRARPAAREHVGHRPGQPSRATPDLRPCNSAWPRMQSSSCQATRTARQTPGRPRRAGRCISWATRCSMLSRR